MGRIAGIPNSHHHVWTPDERARARLAHHARNLWLEATADKDRDFRRLLYEACEAVCMVAGITSHEIAVQCMEVHDGD